MKKPLSHTKVTVKLRKSQYKEEWYLIVEAYPVIGTGGKVERVVESVNRSITTPVWDKTSSTRGAKFKPKRDINGIIQCRTAIDQESCVYADNVRELRQHEYDNQVPIADIPLKADTLEQTVKGVYDNSFIDWKSDSLTGRRLNEYNDIHHCAEVFAQILAENRPKMDTH